ncbi:MAG: pilus assembly protein PilM [Candidatus Omnitrophica bacterium]|nr:pilus assembly protein PilM [Candidatus Omnitrophota bacterium]MDE2222931.1 pilus assembly protein PilM [Candidatus Omnitrophota bacterium]
MKSNIAFYINEKTVKFLQVALPQNEVTDVEVIHVDGQNDVQISETLSSFVRSQKLNLAESRVTVVIPRSRAILRSMVLPSHDEDEIRAMIDLQIGGQIPYAREEVDLDFQVLSKTQYGHSKVAVIVIPQEIATRYWRIFDEARIPVSGITISSVGLWLLFRRLQGPADDLCAVFDLDLDRTEICLCDRNQWLTSREISAGLRQIKEGRFKEILTQWELTQNTFRDSDSKSVETVLLISSDDRAHPLAVEISKAGSHLIVRELLTQTMELVGGQWPSSMTVEGASFFSLAGIAFSEEPPPVNLIPGTVRQAQQQRSLQRQWIVTGAWLIAAVISMGLVLGSGYLAKKIQLAGLEGRLHAVEKKSFKAEDQLKKMQDIETLVHGRLVFSDLANELYRIMPPQIYLTVMTVSSDNKGLSFEGVSSTPAAVNQFQKNMVASSYFANVALDYVNKRVGQQGEMEYFKISSTLRNAGGHS